MQNINFRAFTLVELIVVITIVGILSTVGFVSYSGYLTGARDSNRISQMVKLSDSLQVYSASKTLPLPDDYVEITASGTVIGYQGNIGVDVLETIDYTNGGTDPKDDSYYTYYLTKDRNSMQLLALMEEQQSVASTNTSLNSLLPGEMKLQAADYSDRFPKVYGRKLGVYTQVDTNTPIQQLSAYDSDSFDIVLEIDSFISHIADDEKLEGTGSILMASNPKANCKRIKQTGGGGNNGVYTISPLGIDFNVYCDMEIDGGGWTAATMLADTTIQNIFDTGNTNKITSITENISSKGTISDIWKDNFNKDIMVQCFTSDPVFKNYEIPFIIYDFKKIDILNLTKANKAGTAFSSSLLKGKWNGKTLELNSNYGPSSNSNSFYIRTSSTSTDQTCFGLNGATNINMPATTTDFNCPGYNDTGTTIATEINDKNYCISYIK